MIGRKIVAAVLIAGFALVAGTQSISAEPRGWDRGRGRSWGSARGRGRGRGWGTGWWHKDRPDAATSFWGGVIGGLVGQALRPDRQAQDVEGEIEPGTEAWYEYCTRRYRSFDPETGTYLGFDGVRKPCR